MVDEFIKSLKEVSRQKAREAREKNKKGFENVVQMFIENDNIPILPSFIENLTELRHKRNRIVHEGDSEIIEIEQVYQAYGNIKYLLCILGKIAIIEKIPFVDEFSTLHKLIAVENNIKSNSDSK